IDELFHPHGVGHIEGRDVGPTEFKAVRDQLLTAFPDLLIEVEDTAADGEHVVVRWRASATHLGNALGFEPTQRRVAFRGMTWLTFRAGRIVEGWDSWNMGKLPARRAGACLGRLFRAGGRGEVALRLLLALPGPARGAGRGNAVPFRPHGRAPAPAAAPRRDAERHGDGLAADLEVARDAPV